jgi:hypothetical protein
MDFWAFLIDSSDALLNLKGCPEILLRTQPVSQFTFPVILANRLDEERHAWAAAARWTS